MSRSRQVLAVVLVFWWETELVRHCLAEKLAQRWLAEEMVAQQLAQEMALKAVLAMQLVSCLE